MRARKSVVLFALMALFPIASLCQAEVNVGLSLDKDGIKSFCLAIGEHFNVEEKKVVVVREAKIPDEDLPVVFFLASRAGISPDIIVKMRLGGKSWMDISLHFGLTAGVFYVPVKGNPGPPYGKAYGHFKNRKKEQWGSVRLTDVEIADFVNLRFISERYGYSPDEVIKLRSSGKSFVSINSEVKAKKAGKKPSDKIASQSDEESKGKGKSKGKKK
ncbi:MAG: hypothetical protein JSV44_01390 [Candidatus Zixiibacteriota bacterium]|nr:MAG: hypothetical protein JSV44_01390 [candidate division Zixibacteria bacterium]